MENQGEETKGITAGNGLHDPDPREISGLKEWEIWMEGFAATGQSEKAQLIGVYEAETFDEAVQKYIQGEIAEHGTSTVELNRFGQGRHAIWGCELFDNETDARKSFG